MNKPMWFIVCLFFFAAFIVGCARAGEVTTLPALTETESAPATSQLLLTQITEPPPTQSTYDVTPSIGSGMVDIGGRNLYYTCAGAGSPTVIIESAWGNGSSDYDSILTVVSKHTLVCAYDRAGLGKSDPTPSKPRTSQDMVDDLHALLDNVHLPGPYILVGHSLGGFNIRLYASQYPQDVVGMVFVEGVPTDQFLQCELPTESPNEDASFQPARESCQAAEAAFSDWSGNTEGLDYFASEDQVRQTGSFGDLPLAVLVAESQVTGKPGSVEEFQGVIWDRLEREMSALSSNGQYRIIQGTTHASIVDNQETWDAIIRMVEEIQSKK